MKIRKPAPANKIFTLLSSCTDTSDIVIRTIFGDPNYATDISAAFKNDKPVGGHPNPLILFCNENINELLDWVLTDKHSKEEHFEMISTNIITAITTGGANYKKSFWQNNNFTERFKNFINSDNITERAATNWSRIFFSVYTLPSTVRSTVELTTDEKFINKVLAVAFSQPELLGYRQIILCMIEQSVHQSIFYELTKVTARNMREYQLYTNIDTTDDEITIEGIDDNSRKKLLLRTYYLLNLFSTTYVEFAEMRITQDFYGIIQNLLLSLPLFFEHDTTKFAQFENLVINSAVTALSLVMDIIHEGSPDHLLSQKLVKQTGIRLYEKLFNNIEISRDMPNSEIAKLDLVIRTFPVFWEAGINRLAPLLFRTFGETSQETDTDFTQNSIVPGKIGYTVIDRLTKWILSINSEKTTTDKEKTRKRLYKFLRKNSIVQNLREHFPKDRLENTKGPFLNPYILSIAELLSYGYVKFENDFDGDSTKLNPNIIMLDGTVETMENDEYSRFIAEELAPVSDSMHEMVRDSLFNF